MRIVKKVVIKKKRILYEVERKTINKKRTSKSGRETNISLNSSIGTAGTSNKKTKKKKKIEQVELDVINRIKDLKKEKKIEVPGEKVEESEEEVIEPKNIVQKLSKKVKRKKKKNLAEEGQISDNDVDNDNEKKIIADLIVDRLLQAKPKLKREGRKRKRVIVMTDKVV